MTMRASALALAAQGFKVFPIKAGQKTPPLVSEWQVKATTDTAQIEAWWAKWPTANVGVHCDGLIVLDVDAHKGGFDSLTQLKKEIPLAKTLTYQTPRGGLHIVYRSAVPVANGVDVLGTGIDVRARAGYVVGCGSTTADGSYAVRVEAPVVEVSPELFGRLSAVRTKPKEERKSEIQTDTAYAVARATVFLEQYPVAMQGKGGDHTTYTAVCRVRDFGVPEHLAAEALADWNSRCMPPWDSDELAIKIENAYAYAQDDAGREAPESMFDEVPPEERGEEGGHQEQQEQSEEQPKQQSAQLLLHPSDVVEKDVLHVPYLIKHMVEKGANAMLFGTWNVGKTFVVLDMAASIACGLPWFGHRVKQARVLYLGYEGIRAIKKRMIALRQKYPALNLKETPFRWGALRGPIATEDGPGYAEVKLAIAEFRRLHGGPPDLLIIDPLQNALGGDDSDPELIARFNQRMANVRRVDGCAVLRVHHTGHTSEERARGHSSIPADVDTNIRVTRDNISAVKQRDDQLSGHEFLLREVALGVDQDGEPVTTMVVEHLSENPKSGKLTRTQADLMAKLVQRHGDGGKISATDITDACPDEMPAEQKRKLRAKLVLKEFLIEEDGKFIIHATGPAPQFTEEA
jgi:hypothetical protein